MKKEADYLEIVGALVDELEKKNMNPVLVGGMALVLLGSQRVTSDFDFLVSIRNLEIEEVVNLFYGKNFELVSKINKQGEVVRTIDNKKVAVVRLKLDAPRSAYFYNWDLKLKIDLLFDFPLSASEIAARAQKIDVQSHVIRMACREDLIRLKEIAYKDRHLSVDAQDMEFLRNQ